MEKSWRVSFYNYINICVNPVPPVHREQQRAQRVFKAAPPMDLPAARNKLLGFGMQLLDGIDPNPDNMVCAGIIHTQGQQVGCLLRLEPNRQAQVCIGIFLFCFCLIFIHKYYLLIRCSVLRFVRVKKPLLMK